MKKSNKLSAQQKIPLYLPTLKVAKASDELMAAYSLLNSSIHAYKQLNDEDKVQFMEVFKGWFESGT
jgi:hypothetical protein